MRDLDWPPKYSMLAGLKDSYEKGNTIQALEEAVQYLPEVYKHNYKFYILQQLLYELCL